MTPEQLIAKTKEWDSMGLRALVHRGLIEEREYNDKREAIRLEVKEAGHDVGGLFMLLWKYGEKSLLSELRKQKPVES